MSLGWAAEAAPAGGMDAVQKLIEQRMEMARNAEAVRHNMAQEAQAKAQLEENANYRRDTFGAQQATRDQTAGEALGKTLSMGDDVTGIAPALNKGMQGPNMSAPAYAPMPVPAPPSSLADPTQDQTAPLPSATGGGPYVPNAPSLDSPNVTKRITWLGTPQERAAKQKEDATAAYGRTLTPGTIPDQVFQAKQAGVTLPAETFRDREGEAAQRKLDHEEIMQMAASLRPSPQPQILQAKDGSQHAILFQNGKATEVPLPDPSLKKVGTGGAAGPKPLPYQQAENIRAMNVADVEGTKVLKALHASGLDTSNDPADPRWTNFVATTLKIAPADFNKADVLQRTSFVQAALTRTLMGGRPSQYIAEMIAKHMPQGTMSGQQLAHIMSNVLEQTAESRKESANLSGRSLESILPVSGQHYQQYLDELTGNGGANAAAGAGDWVDVGGVKVRRKPQL